MLSRIRDFIRGQLAADETPSGSAHGRHLAAAALLFEVARADYEHDPRELLALRTALQRCFDLGNAELDTLVALAQQEAAQATSSHSFTRVVNEEFSNEEKSRLLQSMWEVAYADDAVDRYEEHLIRKIAALIYVPHAEFIRTKHLAAAARAAQR